MATRYTIADGDILNAEEPYTWDGDGSVPGSADVAVIEHACTMSPGTFAADVGNGGAGWITLDTSGTRIFTGDFQAGIQVLIVQAGEVQITGNVSGGVAEGDVAMIALQAGTLTVTGNVNGGGGSNGENGVHAIGQTGGSLIVVGNVVGGDNGENGESPGHGIVSDGGTLAITGDLSPGEGGSALVIHGASGAITIVGNALGSGSLTPVIRRDDGSRKVDLRGLVTGVSTGSMALTGSIANLDTDRWAYEVPNGLTLDLSGLVLTNYGRFAVIRLGGTVTTDGTTAIHNQTGAQAVAIGCDLSMTWAGSESGLTQGQVQEACAAALAAYDPPTKAEMDVVAATLAPAATALSSEVWTAARAAFVDHLNVGGAVASSAELSAVATHGDATWKTATGFATSEQLAAVQTHGDASWATASGFATPGDAMTLASAERSAIAAAVLSADVAGQIEAAAADHSLCYVILAASQFSTEQTEGKLTVFRADGETVFVEKTVRSQSTASVITGVQ